MHEIAEQEMQTTTIAYEPLWYLVWMDCDEQLLSLKE